MTIPSIDKNAKGRFHTLLPEGYIGRIILKNSLSKFLIFIYKHLNDWIGLKFIVLPSMTLKKFSLRVLTKTLNTNTFNYYLPDSTNKLILSQEHYK